MIHDPSNIEKRCYVYKLTAPNGKVYIGLTHQKVTERWRDGKGYKRNKLFWADINKYGWENIQREVIASDLTIADGLKLEGELIHQYKSIFPEYGYNRRTGLEHREDLADAKIVRSQSEEELKYYPPKEPKPKSKEPRKDTCWINDGMREILIPSNELNDYLECEWIKGRLATDIVYIHKDNKCIRIHECELSDYMSNGWSKGKSTIISENIKKSKQQFIWKCDGKEFPTAMALAEYLRATHYPKIVASTITAMFNGKNIQHIRIY